MGINVARIKSDYKTY